MSLEDLRVMEDDEFFRLLRDLCLEMRRRDERRRLLRAIQVYLEKDSRRRKRMNKPTRDEINAMSPGEYRTYAGKFVTACASCGRVGQAVTESIEAKGFSYCDDEEDCKKHR